MLRHLPAILAAALLLPSATVRAEPVTYTIVSKLSRVNFTLEHQGFIQLFGTLRLAPGSFVFDKDDWSRSSINVSLPTRSLDMGDAHWNNQIRDDDAWLGLFRLPAIEFRSTAFEHLEGNRGVLRGQLSLAGMTRPVTLQVRVNKLGRNEVSEYPSVGFSATTTLKRSEFGLDAYSDLVGDEIGVQIQLEAAVGPDADAKSDLSAVGVKP